jgi:hypothetical protein
VDRRSPRPRRRDAPAPTLYDLVPQTLILI